ncbi:MAG: hypothetical protein MI919_28185 [Holophagales bacterium]|nr:hypothetical protein [Holophagales bacterium]
MANKGSQLSVGQSLEVDDYLVSPSGRYFAILQRDGNFCVYRGNGPANQGDFVWGSVQAAGYKPRNGEYFVIMQDDGNFCQYKGTPANQGGFVWGTVQVGGYRPKQGAYFAIMQDDGNFCVYEGGFKFGTIQNPV